MNIVINRLPLNFDSSDVQADFLNDLGLTRDPINGNTLEAAHGSRRFTVSQVDEALAKTKLDTADRIAVKSALARRGLLGA